MLMLRDFQFKRSGAAKQLAALLTSLGYDVYRAKKHVFVYCLDEEFAKVELFSHVDTMPSDPLAVWEARVL